MKQGKAATFDPNYQTLAGIGGDVFGPDKKKAGGGGGGGGGGKPIAPANQVRVFLESILNSWFKFFKK